jgi:hypothetical protein
MTVVKTATQKPPCGLIVGVFALNRTHAGRLQGTSSIFLKIDTSMW